VCRKVGLQCLSMFCQRHLDVLRGCNSQQAIIGQMLTTYRTMATTVGCLAMFDVTEPSSS
jgi:hypothetical protein